MDYILSILQNLTTLSHYLIYKSIEVIALDSSLTITHSQTEMRYTDRKTTEELKKTYPTLSSNIKDIYYMLKDNKLPIEDMSHHFIINNHII